MREGNYMLNFVNACPISYLTVVVDRKEGIRIYFFPKEIFHSLIIAFVYKIPHCEENVLNIVTHSLHIGKTGGEGLIIRGDFFLFPLLVGCRIFIKGCLEK